MDHELAVQALAVERYFLGEMAPEERDAFEEHYFCCAACASDVHLTAVFVTNARAVLAPRSRAPARVSRSRFRAHFAIAACAVLGFVAVAGYQNMITIPVLQAPQSFGSVLILDGATRASLPRLRFGEPLRFQMALDWPKGARVIATLKDSSGKALRRGSVEAPGLDQPLDVYFPLRLNPGRYALVIQADRAGTELARHRFEIVSQESKTE